MNIKKLIYSKSLAAHTQTSNRGFTFIEVLITVSIVAIIVALSANAFSRFNKRQELNNAMRDVLSVLEEARSLTLASKNNVMYGVHFEEGQVTLFGGSVYSPSSPDNKITILSSRIYIATTSFAGGGSDVLFERLTGSTNNSGTTTFAFRSDISASSTIFIHKTGLIE